MHNESNKQIDDLGTYFNSLISTLLPLAVDKNPIYRVYLACPAVAEQREGSWPSFKVLTEVTRPPSNITFVDMTTENQIGLQAFKRYDKPQTLS
jgi:hypothetical protein